MLLICTSVIHNAHQVATISTKGPLLGRPQWRHEGRMHVPIHVHYDIRAMAQRVHKTYDPQLRQVLRQVQDDKVTQDPLSRHAALGNSKADEHDLDGPDSPDIMHVAFNDDCTPHAA